MRKLLAVLAVVALSAPQVFAADAAGDKKLTPQQERMSACSKEAKEKGLKGDERKGFMSTCLKGGGAASAAKTTQQDKMKACNKEAGDKGLKGEERKTFMSTCLSG